MSSHITRSLLGAAGLLAAPLLALAQSAPVPNLPPEAAPKVAYAVRIAGASPVLDGRLEDAAWQQARFFSDFVQKEPNEGATPSESTMVAVLYDDDAIYIAARLYSRDPVAIQSNVSRRDQGVAQSEHIWFSFDSYLDRRTAYSFGVTASGVRMDWYHPVDNEYSLDMTFDPVYEARAHVDSLGWTAELRIPFSQLRFRRQDVQVWGFNVDRWIPNKYEDIFWRPVPKNVTGWASRMGELRGIEGVRPRARLEVMPYAASDLIVASEPDAGNPFDPDGRTGTVRVGGDLKAGVGPNLTLDATINPDFGQVEADPAVINLSAFETIFDERRPFFVEGSQLLRGDGASYYYSRRIGAAPRGSASGDYVDQPAATTIIGAAKLTGRMSSGLSVGVLAALTGREEAASYDTATATRNLTEVAPASGYGVMRLRQQFGPNQSTIGVMLTGVRRDLDPSGPLAQVLTRQAISGGLDWNYRFARGYYEFRGFAGFGSVEGSSSAIDAIQRNSARYFQRPDLTYYTYDPLRTSLFGYTGNLSLAKISGRHWLYGAYGSLESPALELNDIGRIGSADGVSGGSYLTYRETQPSSLFRSYSLSGQVNAEWNYGWDRQFLQPFLSANATFANLMNAGLTAFMNIRSQDERLTRGGPTMGVLQIVGGSASLSSNFGAATQWRVRVAMERGEFDHRSFQLSGLVSLRPMPRWFVSATPTWRLSAYPRQYVTALPDSTGSLTYGTRYIFALIEQSQWSVQLRFNYAFTPDLTLELYAEPFIASGRYSRHGELPQPGAFALDVYGQAPGTSVVKDSTGALHVTAGGDAFTIDPLDFSRTSFRSNMVLRWEWRRGSTLYLVWQQNRDAQGGDGSTVRGRDLFDGLQAAGSNFFALKVSYWLSAN